MMNTQRIDSNDLAFQLVKTKLERKILFTPSGQDRNFLSDINILIIAQDETIRQLQEKLLNLNV